MNWDSLMVERQVGKSRTGNQQCLVKTTSVFSLLNGSTILITSCGVIHVLGQRYSGWKQTESFIEIIRLTIIDLNNLKIILWIHEFAVKINLFRPTPFIAYGIEKQRELWAPNLERGSLPR